jgi:MFS family permease
VRYAWSHPSIRRVLLMAAVIALAGFGHSILAPVFARDVFSGDARTLGFLMSATGVGSLLAGVILSWRTSPARLTRLVEWGAIIAGISLAGLVWRSGLPVAFLCYAGAGFGTVLLMVSTNTLIQTLVHDEKRGRVLSLFTTAQGLFPIGSLFIGGLAQAFGPRAAMGACGLVCLAAAVVFGGRLGFAKAEPIEFSAAPPGS